MRLQGIPASGLHRVAQWLEGAQAELDPEVWDSAIFEDEVVQEEEGRYLVPSVRYQGLQPHEGSYDTYVDIGGAHGDVTVERVHQEEDGVLLENVRLWTYDEIESDEDVYSRITDAIRSQYSNIGPETFSGKKRPR